MPVVEFRREIGATAGETFRWHARPGAFLRLSPPWTGVEVLDARGGIATGAKLVFRVGTPPFAVRWVAVHRAYDEGKRFVDVQESGPFARWFHEHCFEDLGPGRSVVIDRIDYTLPLGSVGATADPIVRHRLERLFRYRGAVTAADIARHAPYFGSAPLRVAISGASGMLGRQLAAFLTAGGHEIFRLVRGRTPQPGELAWNPETGRVDHEGLEALDAVVHLAGANLADGRWTPGRKREILESRVKGTRVLADAIAVLREPPRVFLSASAVGYYGDRTETKLDESATPGFGFLADVAKAWEESVEPAETAGIRTVRMRFGVVLSSRGGALAKMKPAFLIGAGGPIGDGKQGVSWIALDDALYAILHLIRTASCAGAINVVAPSPVSQSEFASELGRALGRPTVLPLPAFAVRAMFGQLGEETLLSGQRVVPAALTRSGFSWSVPNLAEAFVR